MTVFALNTTVFVLNITGFALNFPVFPLKTLDLPQIKLYVYLLWLD